MPRVVTTRPKDVVREFQRLEKVVVRKAIRRALRASGKVVLAEAKAKAPVKTGRHKKNIKLRAIKRKRNRIGVNITTGTRAELGISAMASGYYPRHQEFGPRPHLLPAFDGNVDVTIKRVQTEIRIDLKKNYQ